MKPEDLPAADDSLADDISASPTPDDLRQIFRTSEDDHGKRLDICLHEKFANHSRNYFKKLIKENKVLVNDKPITKASAHIAGNSKITIQFPAPPSTMPIPEDIPLDILYQDEHFMALSKPALMVVHPAPGTAGDGTLVNALLAHTEELSREGGDFRPGIVHRLDRETSGVILVARTDEAHRELARQFKERLVKKQYLACVHGLPKEHSGNVNQPLGRSLTQRKKQAIRHDEAGKESLTYWQVEKTTGDYSWIRCFPHTGRTHQIRVHLKSIQLPILCDALYGREKRITISEVKGQKPQPTEEAILTRHALHAAHIKFQHPVSQAVMEIECPLPSDMQAIYDLAEFQIPAQD